ncbi:glycosyltransferase [bacterium]|nr:glycosyltransferase [bacterium]
MLSILIGVTALLWSLGIFLLFKIPFCQIKNGTWSNQTTCSIIIPARNEAHNLPNLLGSLTLQELSPNEIIVVDDHSNDATADVARSFGAHVLTAQDLPPGWVGKAWACHQGAQNARSDLLIFLDADITLVPHGLTKLIQTFQAEPGVLSVQPYHALIQTYENLSAFFNIMTMAGMNAFTPLGQRWPTSGLFGPALITSRSDYLRVGGHERVKDKILEDLFLGQEYLAHQIPLRLFGGKDCLSFRMYPNGLRELVQGWSKAFASGAAAISPLALCLTILWIGGSVLTTIMLTHAFISSADLPHIILWGLVYLAYAGQQYWILARIGSFHLWTSLLFPIPLLFFFLVFGQSLFLKLLKKQVIWKDRSIE